VVAFQTAALPAGLYDRCNGCEWMASCALSVQCACLSGGLSGPLPIRTVACSRNTIHLPLEGVNYWRDPAKATIRIIRHNCVSLATGIDGHLSFIPYVMRFFNVLLVQGFAKCGPLI
jgi:hypothetical protein